MSFVFAITMLLINFFKMTLLSGIETARVILLENKPGQDGLASISYGDLNETTACLLGALMTLAPGTTLIEINTEKQELVLHFLVLEKRDETLRTIQHDFTRHLNVINGVLS